MGLIAFILGCTLCVAVLSLVAEKVVFQRLVVDPLVGKIGSVVAGWLMASSLAGWGMADGGGYRWDAFLTYGLGAIILLPLAAWGGYKLRRAQHDDLKETFE